MRTRNWSVSFPLGKETLTSWICPTLTAGPETVCFFFSHDKIPILTALFSEILGFLRLPENQEPLKHCVTAIATASTAQSNKEMQSWEQEHLRDSLLSRLADRFRKMDDGVKNEKASSAKQERFVSANTAVSGAFSAAPAPPAQQGCEQTEESAASAGALESARAQEGEVAIVYDNNNSSVDKRPAASLSAMEQAEKDPKRRAFAPLADRRSVTEKAKRKGKSTAKSDSETWTFELTGMDDTLQMGKVCPFHFEAF